MIRLVFSPSSFIQEGEKHQRVVGMEKLANK
jgi:hypothetical protein